MTAPQPVIREPAAAGSFYPADVGSRVRGLLDAANRPTASAGNRATVRPLAYLVPHAAFDYSGAVAAYAYADLQHRITSGARVNRVVLVGPLHAIYGRRGDGCVIPAAGTWRTPLGDMPVDAEVRGQLSDLPGVVIDDQAHASEHALEVQLPFLQAVLPAPVPIVPVGVGAYPAEQLADIVDCATEALDTLLIVSSDLSHGLPADDATAVDQASLAAIAAPDPDALPDTAGCGNAATLRGFTTWLTRHDDVAASLLDYRTTADATGDRERPVVGYAAAKTTPR